MEEGVVLAVVEYRGRGRQLGDDGEMEHENVLIQKYRIDRHG